MWCSKCERDVPQIASSDGEVETRCARCGKPAASADAGFEATLAAIPLDWDDWDLDDDLRRAEQIAQPAAVRSASESSFQATPLSWSASGPQRTDRDARPAPIARVSAGRQLLSWAVLSVSLMVFVCGGVRSAAGTSRSKGRDARG
ncbi:MAG: hypothetical protein KY475_02685, partial [Planctomycetes bacterium]|nr:hypothetical protein [Planctomycetota bacterium]